MSTETTEKAKRERSRETLQKEAYGKVLRARKAVADAQKQADWNAARDEERLGKKRAELKSAEEALKALGE